MPGGGFGQYDGCTTEWGATSDVWGATYGGPSTNTCPQFPAALQPGCGFRWGWMQGADGPKYAWTFHTFPSSEIPRDAKFADEISSLAVSLISKLLALLRSQPSTDFGKRTFYGL